MLECAMYLLVISMIADANAGNVYVLFASAKPALLLAASIPHVHMYL